jgi:hypothetical protein
VRDWRKRAIDGAGQCNSLRALIQIVASVRVVVRDDGRRTQAFLSTLKELNIEAVTLDAGDYDLPFAKVDYLLSKVR